MPESHSTRQTSPVFVIAEAGVNHNGSVDRALELVRVAVEAGADAVKFQTFVAEQLVTADARRAAYQERAGAGSQRDMLRKLELDHEAHEAIRDECSAVGIEFMSTAFDHGSLRFLVEQMGVHRLKMPSGDITNGPLLLAAARTGKPMIVSTGMSTLEEISAALAVIAFGAIEPADALPTPDSLERAAASDAGRQALRERVTLLHCTSAYPAPLVDVNLRAMAVLAEFFRLPVGYSDHTLGITVPIAAVAAGARVIEKHFTLDRSLPGPDHAASLEPAELEAMVTAIRDTELALGVAEKRPTPSEKDTAEVARRSLIAARPIRAGTVLTADDLAVRRPGAGVSPMRFWEVLGTTATRDYQEGELL